MPPAKIFISHSAKNKAHRDCLEALEAGLVAAGFETWVDRKRLRPGDVWNEEITSALAGCHGAVALLSNAALKRHFVRHELSYLSIRKRTERPHFDLCPILLGGLDPEHLRKGFFGATRFDDFQFISWDDPQRQDSLLEKLEPCRKAAEVPSTPTARLEIDLLSDRVFGTIDPALLQAAAGAVKWTENAEGGWDLPQGQAQLFVRHLLTAPTSQQYNALKEIELPLDGRFEEIFEQVAPFWVDERAALAFEAVLKRPPRRRGVVVNGSQARFTPQMFLRRARAHHKKPKGGLLPEENGNPASPGAGSSSPDTLVTGGVAPVGRLPGPSLEQQALSSILYQVGGNVSADVATLQGELDWREDCKQSIISVLLVTARELPQVVKLQEKYGTVTFFALCGPHLPELDDATAERLAVLKPELVHGTDVVQHNEDVAHRWYCRIRKLIARG